MRTLFSIQLSYLALLANILTSTPKPISAFQLPSTGTTKNKVPQVQGTTSRLYAARYGPPISDDDHKKSVSNWSTKNAYQKQEFRKLLEKIMAVKDPQHLPSLLTKNIDLILSVNGQDGVAVVKSILDEARATQDEEEVEKLEATIETALEFAEDFVNTALSLDDQNKKLLGKIIRTISDKGRTARQREDDLDELFTKERPNFSAGFLRHLEGECESITRQPIMNPESARTLEMLRVIQSRVLEEIGQDLGEGAKVLGQLIGYESDAERNAVLEAGLVVRGPSFALELRELTEEALDGLARVPGKGADPNLIKIMEGVHQTIERYLEREGSPFQ